MTTIDLADDTFVVADAAAVAGWVAQPGVAEGWFPDLHLATTRDRGAKGRQWRVTGSLTGTAEVWVEPWGDGVVVHWFLRGDPGVGGPHGPAPDGGPALDRWADRERRLRTVRWKQVVHRLKDELEAGRRPGERVRTLKSGPGMPDRERDER